MSEYSTISVKREPTRRIWDLARGEDKNDVFARKLLRVWNNLSPTERVHVAEGEFWRPDAQEAR